MSRSILFAITLLLLASGCDSAMSTFNTAGSDVSRFTSGIFDSKKSKSPRAAALKMEDQYFPDERREGINELVDHDFGKHEPYTQRYIEIATNDEDWMVRATAIRALNRSRDRAATPTFIRALGDKSEYVRLEAAKALVHMPDEAAVPALTRIVQNGDENRDVRIAAAQALQHYHSLEAARALANSLSSRDFGVAWQSHQTLILLTGHDMQYDEAAWLAYLTGPEKPFG